MDETAPSLAQVLTALLSPSPDLLGMIGLSLLLALGATLAAGLLALPLAYWLVGDPRTRPSRTRRWLTDGLYALMALPAQMVGLGVYLLLSQSGPLGLGQWLFQPAAIGLAQTAVALPLITALCCQALDAVPDRYTDLTLGMGASDTQLRRQILWQAKPWLAAALSTGGARLLGETGAALIVGGNIVGATRTLPTGMAQHVQHGDFLQAIGLGLVLVVLALALSVATRRSRRV